MPGWLSWGLGIALAALLVDRLLLAAEARGWIHWRRTGLSRGGFSYHTLQLHSFFEPGAERILEERVSEEREEDDSGAPPGDARPTTPPDAPAS